MITKEKLSKLSPLLFTIFGIVFLGFVSWKQFSVPRPLSVLILQLAMISIYVFYMGFESRISIQEIDQTSSDDYDRNTMELAAIIKIALLFSCLGLGNTVVASDVYPYFALAGIMISVLGFFVRGRSILDLGKYYGHRIRPLGDYLHDKGMYSIIRHGAYSGTFFIHFGVTLVFPNLFSLILINAWLMVVILRIKLEEDLLMKDQRYQQYAKKTKYRMLPAIW